MTDDGLLNAHGQTLSRDEFPELFDAAQSLKKQAALSECQSCLRFLVSPGSQIGICKLHPVGWWPRLLSWLAGRRWRLYEQQRVDHTCGHYLPNDGQFTPSEKELATRLVDLEAQGKLASIVYWSCPNAEIAESGILWAGHDLQAVPDVVTDCPYCGCKHRFNMNHAHVAFTNAEEHLPPKPTVPRRLLEKAVNNGLEDREVLRRYRMAAWRLVGIDAPTSELLHGKFDEALFLAIDKLREGGP